MKRFGVECMLLIYIYILILLSMFLSCFHFSFCLEKQAYFLFKLCKREVTCFLSQGPVL